IHGRRDKARSHSLLESETRARHCCNRLDLSGRRRPRTGSTILLLRRFERRPFDYEGRHCIQWCPRDARECNTRPRPGRGAGKMPVVARMSAPNSAQLLVVGTKLAMIGRLTFVLLFVSSIANASPLSPGQVVVVDGDTVRIAGETFRLVGFDAPETYRARCPSERELGNRATFRLRQLVAGGGLDLERVACSCASGTEGTRRCNYGRSCGT